MREIAPRVWPLASFASIQIRTQILVAVLRLAGMECYILESAQEGRATPHTFLRALQTLVTAHSLCIPAKHAETRHSPALFAPILFVQVAGTPCTAQEAAPHTLAFFPAGLVLLLNVRWKVSF